MSNDDRQSTPQPESPTSRELDEKELGRSPAARAAAVSRLRCAHFSTAKRVQ